MSQRKTEFTETGSFDPGGHPFATQGTLQKDSPTKAKISTTAQVEAQEKKLINGMEFVSVQNEIERYYDVPNKERRGETIRVVIKDPQWLFVRSSGAHQVVTPDGFTHYIPNSFVHLAWKQKEGTDLAEF
jgi:hypothetical protein